MKPVIGILGGGQLARMLCDAAHKQGAATAVYDPSPEACARLSAGEHICADYLDLTSLQEFGKKCSVITYEFENVPVKAAAFLEKHFNNLPQGCRPLELSSHRIREKSAAAALGIPTPKFLPVNDKTQLTAAIKKIGLPAVLKTCSGGYDGKGQWLIYSMDDVQNISLAEGEYILEEKISFDSEASCIVIRTQNECVCLPPAENIHQKGILHLSIVPARIPASLENSLKEAAQKLITGLNFVGILGVEFFIKGNEIYFNEMAPRPHNSAHYSMDACTASQFDLLISALLNKPLPQPRLIGPAVMLNILGEHKEFVPPSCPGMSVHIYGKTEWKAGRKMGHITFTGNDLESIIFQAQTLFKEKK